MSDNKILTFQEWFLYKYNCVDMRLYKEDAKMKFAQDYAEYYHVEMVKEIYCKDCMRSHWKTITQATNENK